ncbi:MAG: hypothetical protein HRU06_07195 [Oceanospirillaceae bacterium]|nr:hypothetical protein [Oceanospirillaceae bacterium]
MAEKDSSEIEKIETQIHGLFAKCKVPETIPEQRLYGILLRVFHETSLVDLIQFVVKLTQTMCVLAVGPGKRLESGEKNE